MHFKHLQWQVFLVPDFTSKLMEINTRKYTIPIIARLRIILVHNTEVKNKYKIIDDPRCGAGNGLPSCLPQDGG